MYKKETILSFEQAFGAGFDEIFGRRIFLNDAVVSSGNGYAGNFGTWVLSNTTKDDACAVGVNGSEDHNTLYFGRFEAVRPASLFVGDSSLAIPSNAMKGKRGIYRITKGDGIVPQTKANDKDAKYLEANYKNMTPLPIGFHMDSVYCCNYEEPKYIKENYYAHDGKIFVRRNMNQIEICTFIDGTKGKTGDIVWLEVEERERTVGWYEPKIGRWSNEPKEGWECWVVDDSAVFSGIQFALPNRKNKYDGNFEKTTLNRYIQDYFVPNIEASKAYLKSLEQNKTSATNDQSVETKKLVSLSPEIFDNWKNRMEERTRKEFESNKEI